MTLAVLCKIIFQIDSLLNSNLIIHLKVAIVFPLARCSLSPSDQLSYFVTLQIFLVDNLLNISVQNLNPIGNVNQCSLIFRLKTNESYISLNPRERLIRLLGNGNGNGNGYGNSNRGSNRGSNWDNNNKCDNGQIVNGKCTCSPGYYLEEHRIQSDKCEECDVDNCYLCDSKDSCNQCKPGYFISQKKKSKVECERCYVSDCDICDSAQTCQKCKPPYTLDNSKNCVQCKVNQGYFIDNNNVCKPCKNCSSCKSEDDNSCAKNSCANGRQFVPNPSDPNFGSCIQCDETKGQFIQGAQCLNCHLSCKTCSGVQATNCKICKDPSQVIGENNLCGVCNISGGSYIESSEQGDKCKTCHQNCKTCKNQSTQCTSCNPQMGLDNSNCVSCLQKDGVFIDDYGKCVKCDQACKTCNKAGSQNCLDCADGYILDQKICKKCDTNQGYFIAADKTCQKCNDLCATCKADGNSKQSCYTCKGINKWIYLDYNSPNDNQMQCGTCKTSEGFYLDPNSICKKCPSNCIQCSIKNGSVQCDKCSSNFYFDGNTNDCKECNTNSKKFIENGLNCKSCDPSCDTCTSGGPNSCITCSTGLVMHQEKRICIKCDQPGEMKSIDGLICLQCKGNCKDCNQIILSACTSCLPGYFLMPDNSCQKCEGNQFIDNMNNCLPCHYSCNGCQSQSNNQCKSCAIGYSKKVDSAVFECIKCPQQKYFVNSNSVCTKCDDSCLECSGPLSTNCTKCQNGEDPSTNGGVCSFKCQINEYFNGVQCLPCHSSCSTCNNVTSSIEEINSCIECAGSNKKQLIAGSTSVYNCVDCQTSKGFYSDNIYCYECTSKDCDKCSGDKGSICQKCKQGKFLLNGECVDCKESGYYQSTSPITGGNCNKCPSNCKICKGPYNESCSACMDNFYFNSSKECITCPDELFFKENNECKSCHVNCLKCENGSGEANCTVCKNNLYLINGTCQFCPTSNYFEKKDEHKCLKCDDSCETCNDTKPESCISCKEGYYFHQENGKKLCKPCEEKKGFFIDQDLICKPCSKSCATCSGQNINQCLSCQNNFALMKDSTCVECREENGYFIDPESQQCDKCNQSCKTCNGTSENHCTSCFDNKFLSSDKMCVDCTNPGEFKDTTNKQCIQCYKTCETCDGPNQNNCLTCKSQYSYFEDQRICEQCNTEGFFNKDQKCIKCDETCKTCNGATKADCTNCKDNLSWNSQDFCEKCPEEGYFIDQENTCLQCPKNCKKCTLQTQCSQCEKGFLVEEASKLCVKCEEMRGYFADEKNGICRKCDKSCISCQGPSSFDCIDCKDDYFQIDDTKECKLCNKTDSYNQQAKYCQKCENECSNCTHSYTYVEKQNVPKSINSDTQLCQQCKCSQCKRGYALVNGSCVSNCSQYGENFEDDPQYRSCKCKEGYQYQIYELFSIPKKQFCSQSIPSGFQCLQNNKCYPCAQNCLQCQSQNQCGICNDGFYLWEGQCVSQCFPESNIIENFEKKICQCKQGYLYLKGENEKEASICLIPLKLDRIEISNPFMSQGKADTSENSLNNIITFVLNRVPRKNEIADFSIFINENKLTINVQYFIRDIKYKDNLIIVEIEVPENRRITELTYTLNGAKNNITLKNALLTSKEYNKEQLSEKNTASEGMQGVSGLLTPKDGDTKELLDNLKRFQILCFLSNFVQVLAPITIFKDSLPPQIYIGGQLGASFIFSDLQATNQVSFNQNSTVANSNKTTSKRQLKIQSDNKLENNLLKKMNQQGVKQNPKGQERDTQNEDIKGNQNDTLDNNTSQQNQDKPNQPKNGDKDQSQQNGSKDNDNKDSQSNSTGIPSRPNQGDKSRSDKPVDNNKEKCQDQENKDRNRNSNDNKNKEEREDNNDRDRRPHRPPKDFNCTNTNSTKQTTTDQIQNGQLEQEEEKEIFENSKLEILHGFGLSQYLYGNFIYAHLIIVISTIIIILCLIARRILPGKQYTLQIVNRIINTVCSFSQGCITSGIFSIYYSLQFSSGRGLAIFQLIIHLTFIIEMLYMLKSRPNKYIQNHIPNFFDGINPQIKGAKSYIFISFIKKYIIILLFLIFSQYPVPCSITIAIIFFLQGLYIAKYRFFKSRIINFLKIFQEWMICTLFILLAICMKKYESLLQDEVISNSVLRETKNFSFILIVLIIICLSFSLLIFVIRSIVSIAEFTQMIYKYLQKRMNKGLISSSDDLAELSDFSSRIHSNNFSKKFLNTVTYNYGKNLSLPKVKSSLQKSPSPNLTEEE